MMRHKIALRAAITGKPIDPSQNDTARRTSLLLRKVTKAMSVSVARRPSQVTRRTDTELR
jgi:hypothetical protein